MNRDESERLWALVRELQRAPPVLDDVEAQRAVTVLTASRSDAVDLLMHRVLVLELALDAIRARTSEAPVSAARSSAFVRDAAVIAAGVVGGGLVLGALDTLGEAILPDADAG